jgi:LPXTG-motif cell wall-anchored protein
VPSADNPCDQVTTPPTGTNRPPTVLGTEAFRDKPAATVQGTEALAPAGLLPNTGVGALVGLAGVAGALLVAAGAFSLRRRGQQG